MMGCRLGCRLVLGGAVALLAGLGCSKSDAADGDSKLEVAQSSVARVSASNVPESAVALAVQSNNAFAVDLYRRVLAKHASGNVLTSPVSASLALTMTYAGARGDTATEMASALHFGAATGDTMFAGQNALSQALNGRAAEALARATTNAEYGDAPAPAEADYQLQVVNSVWGERTYRWEPPFLDVLAANYGTGVYQQDFIHGYEAARAEINDWVGAHTNDKIEELLPQGSVDDRTRMVLVNALHLKLPWAEPFKVEATATADFTRNDASVVSASFMHQTASLPYVDDGQAQIVWLPLSGGGLSVVIAEPHEGVELAAYEATLTEKSAALSAATGTAAVELSIPKTAFTSASVSLAEALKAMGMERAFDAGAADFLGLCAHVPDGGKLYVGDVLQKAMVAMEESGVEAAAATAVLIRDELAVIEPPVPMAVNRPYVIGIVDNQTNALLMLGHIQDPTDKGSP